MHIGLRIPMLRDSSPSPWESTTGVDVLVRLTRHAEQLGFDFVTSADHIIVPCGTSRIGPRWLDPFVSLGFLAAATIRIRLMTAVIVLPYRNPLHVAKAASTLDFLSGGRLILGVGAGHLEGEFQALGVSFQHRGAMTDEYLKALKAALTLDIATFQGSFCKFQDVVVEPRPVQKPHPPIWVGGDSKAALRRAVAKGDGWSPNRLEREQVAEMLAWARTLPAFPEKESRFSVNVLQWLLGGRSDPGQKAHLTDAHSFRRSSAERMLHDLERWVGAGATHITLGINTQTPEECFDALQWFGEAVMPHSRAL